MEMPRKPTKPPRAKKGMGSIVKKGSRYYGRLRRDGQEIYTEAFATEDEARQALERLRAGQLDPRFLPSFEMYWESLIAPDGAFEFSKDKATLNLYDTMLALHVRGSDLGKMRIDQVRRHHVQRHIDRSYKPKFKEASVRRLGSCIHTVFQEAVDSGMIHATLEHGVIVPANPADGVKYRRIPDTPVYVFSDQELMDLPAELYEWSPRLSAMVTIMADTGARPGEVCAMHKVDLRDGAWLICRQMGRDGEEKPKTKNSRSRRVWLTEDALAAIAAQGRRTGYIFLTEEGKPLTPDYLGTQLRRFRAAMQRRLIQEAKGQGLEEAPIMPPLTPRNLRKTFVTRGVELGDVKSVQAAVGHKSAQTTLDVYAKARQNPQKELIERMQRQVSGRFGNIGGANRGSEEEHSSKREAG